MTSGVQKDGIAVVAIVKGIRKGGVKMRSKEIIITIVIGIVIGMSWCKGGGGERDSGTEDIGGEGCKEEECTDTCKGAGYTRGECIDNRCICIEREEEDSGVEDGEGRDSGDEEEVECEGNEDCLNAIASRCEEGMCIGCMEDGDCAHIEGKTKCSEIHECVECKENRDCEGGKKCVGNECVECEENSECEDEGASRCEGGECVGCEEDGDCAHIEGKTKCNEQEHRCVECKVDEECEGGRCRGGECVECIEDEDCRCEDVGCNSHRVCIGNECRDECMECERDEECEAALGSNYYCVIDDIYSSTPAHCAKEAQNGSCDRGKMAVLTRTNAGSSIEQKEVCIVGEGMSCEGLGEIGVSCNIDDNALCGVDSVNEDSTCRGGECTYVCVDSESTPHDEWCPEGWHCGGIYCERD